MAVVSQRVSQVLDNSEPLTQKPAKDGPGEVAAATPVTAALGADVNLGAIQVNAETVSCRPYGSFIF